MPKRIGLALVVCLAALAFAVAGCGGDDDDGNGEAAAPATTAAEEEQSVTVDLGEQNGSGESGTATLTTDGVETVVVIELTGAPADTPQPAHIHSGTCAELGDVVHPLTNVEGGASETTVAAPLADLQAAAFAINVHESEEAIQNYVACGEIPAT
jgi:Cu/Zn superoxide dismutase